MNIPDDHETEDTPIECELGWPDFVDFIQKSEGYTPHPRDSMAKHQFRIYAQGMLDIGMKWNGFVKELNDLANSHRNRAIESESEQDAAIATVLEELIELL